MPVPTRRQAQQYQFPPPEEADDTDSDIDVTGASGRGVDDDGETIGEERVEFEEEDDLEDEDALASPNQPDIDLPNLEPPPSYLREISTSAAWTVSSSKPGCSVPQLRHPSTALFWQSDGPQPHYLNIHFFKLVRIAGLRLYLDFEQDESYTPTRIIFLAGSGMNDLQEWGEMRLESPRGWVWADFSGVSDPDSSDDSSDDSDEEMQDSHLMLQDAAAAATTQANHRPTLPTTPSDYENAAPRPQTRRAISDDAMHLDDPQLQTPPTTAHFLTPHDHPPRHRDTPTLAHHQTPLDTTTTTLTTPTPTTTTPGGLPRTEPRHPFTALSPNAQHTTPSSRPTTRRKTPRMPILRAHLVQIKILENHQNGKDTHLRGLQIFTRNDEEEGIMEGGGRGVKGMGTGRKMIVGRGGEGVGAGAGVRREKREERWDLGVGSMGGWDEGGIR
ncbi:hypothetical protein NX059_010343 [Plenodomus lindquistii]|nr:hypothetical protein NX059_010343 [Plenodomus lindquistii]